MFSLKYDLRARSGNVSKSDGNLQDIIKDKDLYFCCLVAAASPEPGVIFNEPAFGSGNVTADVLTQLGRQAFLTLGTCRV